jgi:hypothetical protein
MALPPILAIDDVRSALDDIESVADEFLVTHTERFDPFNWSELDSRHIHRKAFTESSLYAYTLDVFEETGTATELRDLVVDRTNDRRYRHLLLRNPHEFIRYSLPVGYLDAIDELDDSMAAAIDSILDRRTVWSVERQPYRQLDLWHFCQLYGYEDCPLDRDHILSASCLEYPPHPIEAELEDAYAFTHDLLYYHNFGLSHPEFPDEPAPYEHDDVIAGLILRYMADDNCDITLELLLVGVLQRQVTPELVGLVTSWVRQQGRTNGYIPSPAQLPLGEDHDEDIEAWSSTDHEWAENYHTNLVAATTTRVINSSLDGLGPQSEAGPLTQTEIRDALKLGQLLDTLSEYDLERAAHQLGELADSPVRERFPTVFETCVEYVRNQRTPDNEYGYWTDEEAIYLALGNSRQDFVEEMIRPVSEACRVALEAVSDVDGASEGESDGDGPS